MSSRQAVFAKAAKGNQSALVFLATLFEAADIADDIQDETAEPWRVPRLWYLAHVLPANEFYRQHQQALQALILLSGISWDVSNHIEKQVYAVLVEQIVTYVALVCGGYDHAKDVALDLATRTWGL